MVCSRRKKRTDAWSLDFEHGRKLEYLERTKKGRKYNLESAKMKKKGPTVNYVLLNCYMGGSNCPSLMLGTV